MKKRLALILTTCFILGISGCGNKETEDSTKAMSNTAGTDLNDEQTTENSNLPVREGKSEDSATEPTSTIDLSIPADLPVGDTVLYETDFALNESRTGKIKLYGKKISDYFYGISYVQFAWNDGSITGFATSKAVQSYWSNTTIEFTDYTESYNEDGGLMVGDVNFDGYSDIGLQIQTTAYNMPYIYWFYNVDTDQFDYYGSFLDYLEVDETTQTCVVEHRSGQTYYIDIYRPDGKKGLKLVRREITEYIDGQETHRTETYE